jgi:hypothetical protein
MAAARANDPSRSSASNEVWYVAVTPDDVKAMSLDKLDDLYRLGVIDESTRVWGPDMKDWQPLGVVAGLESSGSAVVDMFGRTWDVGAPPPPPTSLAVTWDMEPPRLSIERAAPSGPPISPPGLPVERAGFFSGPAGLPAPAIPAPPLDATWDMDPAALSAVPESLAPVDASAQPKVERTGRAGRWIIGMAIAVGLIITLYRNDVLRWAARALGREDLVLRIERALGGPGFGTPRAVEQDAARMEHR